MALQSSGSISLNDIATEFGGQTPHSLNEYYRNGSFVTANNTNVPTSGSIDFNDFYGAVKSVVVTLSNAETNVSVSSKFGGNFSTNIPKILIIPSGAEIGATGGTGNRAITVPSGMSGTLDIQNSGTISGAGGAGGTSSQANGSMGGSAIFIASNGVTVTNSGTIRGGGGGGGAGHDGSPGANGYQDPNNTLFCNGGSGGGHGDGGNGQGYGSSATNGASGSPGSPATASGNYGSQNPGLCAVFGAGCPGSGGSPGGNGGSFGNNGSNASSGSGSGGLAGRYVQLSGGAQYTLSNSGTVSGTAP